MPHNSYDTHRAEKMKQAIARAKPLARMLASQTRVGQTPTTVVQTRPVSPANEFMCASGNNPARFRSNLLNSTKGNLCVLSLSFRSVMLIILT